MERESRTRLGLETGIWDLGSWGLGFWDVALEDSSKDCLFDSQQ